jgi:hypothetical protein
MRSNITESKGEGLKVLIDSFKSIANTEIRQSKLKNISDTYDHIIDSYLEEREKALAGTRTLNKKDSILDYEFIQSDTKKDSIHFIKLKTSEKVEDPISRKRHSSIFSNLPKRNSPLDFKLENEKFIKHFKNKQYNSYYERSKVLKNLSNNEKEKLRKKIKFINLKKIKPAPGLTESTKRLVKDGMLDERKMLDRLTSQPKKKEIFKQLNRSDMDIKQNSSDNNFDKWLKTNTNWNNYKDFKINRIRQTNEDEKKVDLDDDLYPKPKINKTSYKLASKRGETPIIDRLNTSNKQEILTELYTKHMPSFTPQLNKIYKKPIVKVKSKLSNSLIEHKRDKSNKNGNNDYKEQPKNNSNIEDELYSLNCRDNPAWNNHRINSIVLNRSSDIIQHINN